MFHLPDSNQEMDHHTRELVKLMLAKSLEIMDPKGSYVSLEAIQSGNRDEICIPGDSFNTGRTIVRMLDKAQQYYFFMATAGSRPLVTAWVMSAARFSCSSLISRSFWAMRASISAVF